MNTLFRLAFIGVDHPHGSGWRESLSELASQVEIVAMVSGFSNSLASLEEKYSALPRFESVEALMAWGRFDGAIVCLPNNQAPEAVRQLARAGKAILVEKPAAGNAADWEPAIDEIRSHKVAFQSGYMWRYDDGAFRLKAMFRDRRFGKLISIQLRWFTSDVQRRGPDHYLFNREISGGGFFNWLGCHWLDLLSWVTETRVKAVFARVGNLGNVQVAVEDGGSVILELEDGTQVNLVGGYWLPRWAGEASWSVYGSERWVHWKPNHPGTSGFFEIHGPQPQFMPMDEEFALPQDKVKGYGGRRTLNLILDWVAMARGGSPCRNTPESTLETLRVIDAIYESSRQQKLVVLG